MPLAISGGVTSGTRECDWSSTTPAVAAGAGAWQFRWTDEDVGTAFTAVVRRGERQRYTVSLSPAQCNVLALPASMTLAPEAPGCRAEPDRDQAFVQFWRQLREALDGRDGARLQALALPKVAFVEADQAPKRPASVLAQGAACLPSVGSMVDPDLTIGRLLAQTPPPALDRGPLRRVNADLVSVADAIELQWTAAGWRIAQVNASASVFTGCRAVR